MAGHVAQRAAAEIPPAAPLEAVVQARPVFPLRGHAQPVLPIEPLERPLDLLLLGSDQRVGLLGVLLLRLLGELLHRHATARTLRPNRTVRPSVDFLQIAEHAGAELSDRFARRIERRALVAHLGADTRLGRHLGQQPRFVDRAGQRLLRVATDAQSHRVQRLHAVHVVGRADRRNLDVLAVLGKHLAVIGELLGILETGRFAAVFQRVAVDIADRDDVAELSRIVGVAAAFAANADADHIGPLVRRLAEGWAAAAGNPKADTSGRGDLQEFTASRSSHG